MGTKDLSEAKLAWSLWQRLEELADLLWDRYEQEFQKFSLEGNYEDVMKTHSP
jgi:hypothetical protein